MHIWVCQSLSLLQPSLRLTYIYMYLDGYLLFLCLLHIHVFGAVLTGNPCTWFTIWYTDKYSPGQNCKGGRNTDKFPPGHTCKPCVIKGCKASGIFKLMTGWNMSGWKNYGREYVFFVCGNFCPGFVLCWHPFIICLITWHKSGQRHCWYQ